VDDARAYHSADAGGAPAAEAAPAAE